MSTDGERVTVSAEFLASLASMAAVSSSWGGLARAILDDARPLPPRAEVETAVTVLENAVALFGRTPMSRSTDALNRRVAARAALLALIGYGPAQDGTS